MRKLLITFALGASAFTAAACSAQSTPMPAKDGAPAQMMRHGGRHGGGMMGADGNKDGTITRAEVIAQADARFAKLDTNGVGTVTPAEMQAARMAMRDRMTAAGRTPPPERDGTKMRKHADADGNRTITKADFETRALKHFDRMDANHDGKVDKTEMANMREMRHMRRGEMKQRGMAPGAVPPPADANAQ